jgi:hypothetical protein
VGTKFLWVAITIQGPASETRWETARKDSRGGGSVFQTPLRGLRSGEFWL